MQDLVCILIFAYGQEIKLKKEEFMEADNVCMHNRIL